MNPGRQIALGSDEQVIKDMDAKKEIKVGISYASFVPQWLTDRCGLADYIEVPIELLFGQQDLLPKLCSSTQVILHCASLSLAGNAPPSSEVTERIKKWIRESRTPWLGEHLSYLRMDPGLASSPEGEVGIVGAGGGTSIYDIGYTVSPQFSEPVLERLGAAVASFEDLFEIPVLVENGPIYFDTPGSTMTQWDFITTLCRDFPKQRLLLDLTHLQISAYNLGIEADAILQQLPIEQVDEIHVAGYSQDGDMAWDDHSLPARDSTFALLKKVCSTHQPRAITLEYNADPYFPADVIERDLARVREIAQA